MKPGSNRGRANFKSKLTEEEVLAIYHSKEKQITLAKRYNISQATVNHIKKGRTWAWLTSTT